MIALVLRTMSPPTDTTELAVNDRYLNLLPFRRLAANDSDQPEAACRVVMLTDYSWPNSVGHVRRTGQQTVREVSPT